MERFYSKVNKIDGGCWEWTAGLRGKSGYGAIKVDGKVMDAHRLSYKIHKGEIPKGMYVCHNCDNRKCVNPDHLFLGSAKDNWQDAVDKKRIEPFHESMQVLDTHTGNTFYSVKAASRYMHKEEGAKSPRLWEYKIYSGKQDRFKILK